jgi:hypothetical protein
MLRRTTYTTYNSTSTFHLHPVPRLKTSEAVFPRPNTPSCCVGQLILRIFQYSDVCVLFVFKVQYFRKAYSDNERIQLYLGCRSCTSTCIYMAYLLFQKPSLRMLPYCPERTNLHCPNYRFSPLRHCQFSTDATSCGLQFISFALHYCTIILLL